MIFTTVFGFLIALALGLDMSPPLCRGCADLLFNDHHREAAVRQARDRRAAWTDRARLPDRAGPRRRAGHDRPFGHRHRGAHGGRRRRWRLGPAVLGYGAGDAGPRRALRALSRRPSDGTAGARAGASGHLRDRLAAMFAAVGDYLGSARNSAACSPGSRSHRPPSARPSPHGSPPCATSCCCSSSSRSGPRWISRFWARM